MLTEEMKQSLILNLLGMSETKEAKTDYQKSFYGIGKVYVIRTVTMIYLGKVKEVLKEGLVLEECAWIPDTSRWSEFLKGKKPNEMEPYANEVLVYYGGMLDSTELTGSIKIEVI